MKCNNRHSNVPWYIGVHRWASHMLMAICVISSAAVVADSRTQAKRIHDRLTGISPTNAVLQTMTTMIDNNAVQGPVDAAHEAMKNSAFFNATLKNFSAPWTNEDQTAFVPLNDYTATVIGYIRDERDFHGILSDNIVYTGGANATPYSRFDNDHYEELERTDLKVTLDAGISQPGTPASATAGVMTTRAAAEAFFHLGTNRAMFRFTLMNHLCTDLEPLKDVSRVPDHVRRDVSRSPGGDSRIFLNSCVGCHAGMDGMSPAFAYYDYNETSGGLEYKLNTDPIPNPGGDPDPLLNTNNVVNKINHNEANFKHGYIALDDSWVNYWRNGQNQLLGWYIPVTAGVNGDDKGHATGNGAKALGIELANTDAFDSCQVQKAFKTVCLRDPEDFAADRLVVSQIANAFKGDGNMLNVFAGVAAYCKGP